MGSNEGKLLLEAVSGSSAALQRVLYLYHRRLLAYVTKNMPMELQRQTDPQDLLQDTFFEVTRRIKEVKAEGDDAFFRWVATIDRNRIIDVTRMSRAAKRGGG